MHFRQWLNGTVIAIVAITVVAGGARGDVTLSRVFQDHMVLQRDKPVRIWGWAEAGEAITVSFADRRVRTRAGESGRWALTLEPLNASRASRTLTVSGQNTVKVKDVLVGEV